MHRADAALLACGGAMDGGSIAAVIDALNRLPHPVSVPCLVAALPRPLSLVATTSTLSAQPAVSARSPRLLLLVPGVVVTVVPEGAGAPLIELGQWVSATRTLKGEVELPVTTPLSPQAPFTRIEQSNFSTSCAVCHRAETQVDGGYVSTAYRPNPGVEVKLPALREEHGTCVDAGEVSDRCELFHALFDFGELRQGAFSAAVELFIP